MGRTMLHHVQFVWAIFLVIFVFQGRWLFGFLVLWLLRGFLLLWLFISHHLHSQFLSFRILCISSSAVAFWLLGFLAFWLFGFWRLSGFGFSHPDAFWAPRATPLSIKMHA